jgi:PadR family transcriptional regulator PadR
MPDSPAPQLLPGTLFMLILRTLERGPLHGYAIAKRIRETSDEGLEIEDGSLYPALNRLLVKEWVTAEWGISETGRRARFYRLTEIGRKQLEIESREFERLIKAIRLVMRTA